MPVEREKKVFRAENKTERFKFQKEKELEGQLFFMLFQLSRACSVRQKDHAAVGQNGLLGASVQIQQMFGLKLKCLQFPKAV